MSWQHFLSFHPKRGKKNNLVPVSLLSSKKTKNDNDTTFKFLNIKVDWRVESSTIIVLETFYSSIFKFQIRPICPYSTLYTLIQSPVWKISSGVFGRIVFQLNDIYIYGCFWTFSLILKDKVSNRIFKY